ncbi:transcriptional regulator with XRE-family HTH domain [Rhodobium orientis]|uniref:Transcriptional regulator n=1 Tax=Rhodobium orientis TaxID=34017 RepID=A0A327JG86_9HYPH|nr:helix-turn-helix transcriptional regulator [Rhodobium orientis]MBB4305524.1 transcriptional regulator with XRE-family HTH domain [Rhodobium orientis]MBK5949121.1 transcriptional regulator [Rhodobium orientis]RAI23099.1 transcriptional regulator [Rhodobium orientis]
MSAKSPNPIDVFVGSRVRLQRMILSMSQEQLGAHLGITFQQIQKYEKGTNRISASRLQEIAHVMNVPITFFFQEEGRRTDDIAVVGDTPDYEAIAGFLSSREGVALGKAFTKIKNPKTRQAIVALAKTLAEEGDNQILKFPQRMQTNKTHVEP